VSESSSLPNDSPFDHGAEDPFATFQLHLLGAVAQLERSIIRERQREGIELAKARGVYRGRARRLSQDEVDTARQLVAAGVPKAKVARDLVCARRVFYDALAEQGAYAPAKITTGDAHASVPACS